MQEIAKNVVPTGAYDSLVSSIKSRVDSRHYRDKAPSMTELRHLEIKIADLKYNISNIKSLIDSNRKTIDKLTIENSEIEKNPDYHHIMNLKKQIDADNSKKLSKQVLSVNQKIYTKHKNNLVQIDVLNKDIDENIQVLNLSEISYEICKKQLPEYQLIEYYSMIRDGSIDRAEAIFKKNRDIEELRRLVHHCCESFDKFLYGSEYIAPYKDHLLSWDTAPEQFKRVTFENFMKMYKTEEKAFQEIDKSIRRMNASCTYDWLNDDW